ncbi:hypothetical protein F4775DRAFT_572458 [Biscogniauxia sp. FL1348]|nr:hypothetical protein F4775DRAFT_572458 [Biscogniauxia sp. FL1348]
MAREAQNSLLDTQFPFPQLDIAAFIVVSHARRGAVSQVQHLPRRTARGVEYFDNIDRLNTIIASAIEQFYQQQRALEHIDRPFRPKLVIQIERVQPGASSHQYPALRDIEAELSRFIGGFETAIRPVFSPNHICQNQLAVYLTFFFWWVVRNGAHTIFYGPITKMLDVWLRGWGLVYVYNFVWTTEWESLPPNDNNRLLLSELAHVFCFLLYIVKNNRQPQTMYQEMVHIITITRAISVRLITATIIIPAFPTDDIILRIRLQDTIDFQRPWLIRVETRDLRAWNTAIAKFLCQITTTYLRGTGARAV